MRGGQAALLRAGELRPHGCATDGSKDIAPPNAVMPAAAYAPPLVIGYLAAGSAHPA
jgi:hypothetical protein